MIFTEEKKTEIQIVKKQQDNNARRRNPRPRYVNLRLQQTGSRDVGRCLAER